MTRRDAIKTMAIVAAAAPIAAATKTAKAENSAYRAAKFRQYSLAMNIYIPKIYDNMSSLGYRKF